jgi:hypothetical protein
MLASILPQLVGLNQQAFLKGRSLHDNFKLVKKSTKFLRRKRATLIKLDITKAFDSVAWHFLLEVLRQGFQKEVVYLGHHAAGHGINQHST